MKFSEIFDTNNFRKLNFFKWNWQVLSFFNLKKQCRKFFSQKNLKAVKFIPKILSKAEKGTIRILLGIIVISSFFVWYNHWTLTTREVPTIGGIYTEGVVGEAKDLEKNVVRLTNAGLTRLDENGEVKPDMAERWEVLDDGKTYQFYLRPVFNSYDLLTLLNSKNIWPNMEISTPSSSILTFKFKQPFNPFLYISTEPIFPFGPYKISKEEKKQITFTANNDYWEGKPKITKIIFKFYANIQAVQKATKNNEIMGYLSSSKEFLNEKFSIYNQTLSREILVFFNTTKPDLKNVDTRRKLRDGEVLDKDYTFVLVTSDNPRNLKLAQDLKNKWASLKVNLEIKKYDTGVLQKDIIPKRDYDLLLYSLDYGPDPDPYPFWHSSQNKPDGMNLSNFSNKDADKLLEDARQTQDAKVKSDKYALFLEILKKEIPAISLGKETVVYNVSNEVKGIDKIYGSSEADRFLDVYKWFIKTKRVPK